MNRRFLTALVAAALTVTGLAACSSSTPEDGSPKAITSSTAAEKVTVPDVVGQTRDAARRTLQNRGFAAVDGNVAPTGTDPKVTAQDPAAGSKVQEGETVSLTFEDVPAADATPPAVAESPLVQKIKAQFPGYPLVVSVGSVDSRVQNWAGMGGSAVTQLVAVAPGVYEAYNPAVPNVNFYVDNGPVMGDCILIQATFPDRGSTCWDGVLAGSEEPK
ncbi:hypothetical protein A0130_02580 [Leifsonia xyli]|uniref:PASTA domain-containing protein n=1 Tax=Leifsonia xyli TaxID=1575 RepID=UPI0007CDEA4C|nr:hypothetical protein A0130_02580 [Leifsonia xyli]